MVDLASRFLILGAAGKVGIQVALEALARGIPIVPVVKNAEQRPVFYERLRALGCDESLIPADDQVLVSDVTSRSPLLGVGNQIGLHENKIRIAGFIYCIDRKVENPAERCAPLSHRTGESLRISYDVHVQGLHRIYRQLYVGIQPGGKIVVLSSVMRFYDQPSACTEINSRYQNSLSEMKMALVEAMRDEMDKNERDIAVHFFAPAPDLLPEEVAVKLLDSLRSHRHITAIDQ